jgi:hypothetical protein
MSLHVFWHKAGLDFAPRSPKRSRRVAWVDFLRPAHGNAFLNVSIQEAFGIFQWMVRTGSEYQGVLACLSGKPTCVGFVGVDGFTAGWVGQLRERFASAILEPFCHAGVYRWREENRIGLSEKRMVVFPHYVGGGPDHSDNAMHRRVDALFAVAGRTLAKSHNRHHPNARTVFKPRLVVEADRFTLVLPYGYAEDARGGSSWLVDVAHKGSFADFVDHCERSLSRLLTSPRMTTAPTAPVLCSSGRWEDFDHCGDSTNEPYPFDDDGCPIEDPP